MKFAGAGLLALPVCFAAYGVVRLIGRVDGRYGPGPDWQAAHVVNLVGLLVFIPALVALWRSLPRTRGRDAAVVVALVGAATTVVQFVVDVVAGLLAADKAGMNEISGRFGDLPGAHLLFYVVGPPLLHLGLLALTILLRLPWWSPVLVLVGSALTIFSLDLIPVAGACLLVAMIPLARTRDRISPPPRHAQRMAVD
ncbi:hypothetical protein [Umezawaea sp. Da 62-37]|uniref:hypothetical protein n=1 Tax=Umezawaea sp. Da 62-37 TaxID=3075927 RepID=UPI0028F71FBE|nr:hypothetical protein [Umezawaea sp. Da 62-37]WNV88135.1 hypothetical protein RM788_07545 [Umezawaea sp. Da 62-37]